MKQKGGKVKKDPCGNAKVKNCPNNKPSCGNQKGGAKNKNSEKLKLTVRMLREFYSKI